ncbi:PLP-dependent aminotransferase family protein [Galactobacter valiniphilus]|uniref:PLP-dependent aminotransferase family protein n=1 Tax=Galactobacter valiniphilus TaxID=2676122 RepID=A0A399J7G1_9MICC|nr:PLP-dependent aminotransferase family protein [Galactobacter valiniphilus]RII41421.1 PLP-dependent aminotransferase family protein [Galactobacter valiniphilus]
MNPLRLSPASLHRALGAWRDTLGGEPLHRELAERLRLLILDGRLPLGARLPSERALAEELGLSRTTVASAYDALRASGHAASRQGSGTVATLPGPALIPSKPLAEAGLVDLSRASLPASRLVPPALRTAAEELPTFLSGTGYDLRGLPHLRAKIARHYTERGLPTRPEQVMVTLGAQHAIHLLAAALLRPGDRALVEAPTYPHAAEALRLAGARLVTTPVVSTRPSPPDDGVPGPGARVAAGGGGAGGHAERGAAANAAADAGSAAGLVGPTSPVPDGWDAEQFAATLRRATPALAYLMPVRHNPTGSSMSRATRAAVLAAARDSGTILVIDETTASLDLSGVGPGDAFGDDVDATAAGVVRASETPTNPRGLGRRAAASVVHLGSLGKLFWGGLRVGWIRAEPEIVERCIAARPAHDLGTPVVEQLAAAHLLDAWDEAVAERAEQLRASASALSRLASEHMPGWVVPPVEGGLAAWAVLPHAASSALAIAAREHGVLIPAGPWFGVDGGAFERFVRIPVTVGVEELERAIPALGAAWAEVSSHLGMGPAGPGRAVELV